MMPFVWNCLNIKNSKRQKSSVCSIHLGGNSFTPLPIHLRSNQLRRYGHTSNTLLLPSLYPIEQPPPSTWTSSWLSMEAILCPHMVSQPTSAKLLLITHFIGVINSSVIIYTQAVISLPWPNGFINILNK